MTDQQERKKKKDAEYQRRRYAEDPEYRAKKIAISNAWSRDHAETINQRRRERLRTDPEYRNSLRLSDWKRKWRKLGYDSSIVELYDRMFAAQNGRCAICKQTSDRRLCLDHCRVTKHLRSLLCHDCNMALGLFRDNSTSLREAAAYVDEWRAIHRTLGPFRPAPSTRKRPRRANPARGGAGSAPPRKRALKAREKQPSTPRLTPDVPSRRACADVSPPRRRRCAWTSPLL
jgi:Recombination endonuclease VII